MDENLTFWIILPLRSEMESWSLGVVMNAQRALLRLYNMYEFKYSTFTSFSNKLIFI